MVDWAVWYDDGSSFSSDDGQPSDAPKDGVQVVAIKDASCGRVLWWGFDYYCWHKEGQWLPHSESGRRHYLSKPDEPGIVINGYWIPPQKWAEIYQLALDDPRLPPKTASDPRELPFEAN